MTVLLAALRSLVYAAGFVALWGWLALSARRFDAAIGVTLPDGVRAAGTALMVLGGALVIWCVASFVAVGHGTPAPFDAPRRFVWAGPYRWVRNPMYWGALTVLLGFGLWHRSAAMALMAPAFWLVTHLFVLVYEEPTLEQRFGDSYREYKRRVRRWLPRRPPSPG